MLDSNKVEITSPSCHGCARNINSTLLVLIRHGLLERTSFDDEESSKSPETDSVSLDCRGVDVIKTHAIVRRFFRDNLSIGNHTASDSQSFTSGYSNAWLVITTKVVCESYITAKPRMYAL